MWRPCMDVWIDDQVGFEVVHGRVMAVFVRHKLLGVFVLYCVYFDPSNGGGLAGANKDHMAALLEHSAKHGLPWAALGDWNADPSELAAMHWAEKRSSSARPTRPPEAQGLHQGTVFEHPVREGRHGGNEKVLFKAFDPDSSKLVTSSKPARLTCRGRGCR